MSSNTLPFVRYTAAHVSVGESFSFFASFFLFSKERKKRKIIRRTMFAPTICAANAVKITKTVCASNIQKACNASTRKGNNRRLQAQADSEERAIPPDGFTVFSLEQRYRVHQGINGRTMFAPTDSPAIFFLCFT